tara:strand:+ start:378 stop:1013 length:636 start_codon:yes stop_codon:yes gene_type:complete
MNEFAREYLDGAGFRLKGAGRQWGILDQGKEYPLTFDGKSVGQLIVEESVSESNATEFAHHAAAIVHAGEEKVDDMLAVLAWLRQVQNISPELFNWVGVYFKASYLLGEDSTDLVLGPFIGASTSHTRIPIDRGLCGLALSEERIINQADVHEDPRHIACSITTKSELVIPLPMVSKSGFFAELDIDSNTKAAFNLELETKVSALCLSFPL